MKKKVFLIFALFLFIPLASIAATDLNGRILLKVESKGEAYYINPANGLPNFLGSPDDAFKLIKKLGIGIKNSDLKKIPLAVISNGKDTDGDLLTDDLELVLGTDPNSTDSDKDGYTDYEELFNGYDPLNSAPKKVIDENFVKKHLGKIFLQVESKGEAWYVDPVTSKRYYLGRPNDAFLVMKYRGLGISNKDFDKKFKNKKEEPSSTNNKYENAKAWQINYNYREDVKSPTERGMVGIVIKNEAGKGIPGAPVVIANTNDIRSASFRGYIELSAKTVGAYVPQFGAYGSSGTIDFSKYADKDQIEIVLKAADVPGGFSLIFPSKTELKNDSKEQETYISGAIINLSGRNSCPTEKKIVVIAKDTNLNAEVDPSTCKFKMIVPGISSSYQLYLPDIDSTRYFQVDVMKGWGTVVDLQLDLNLVRKNDGIKDEMENKSDNVSVKSLENEYEISEANQYIYVNVEIVNNFGQKIYFENNQCGNPFKVYQLGLENDWQVRQDLTNVCMGLADGPDTPIFIESGKTLTFKKGVSKEGKYKIAFVYYLNESDYKSKMNSHFVYSNEFSLKKISATKNSVVSACTEENDPTKSKLVSCLYASAKNSATTDLDLSLELCEEIKSIGHGFDGCYDGVALMLAQAEKKDQVDGVCNNYSDATRKQKCLDMAK